MGGKIFITDDVEKIFDNTDSEYLTIAFLLAKLDMHYEAKGTSKFPLSSILRLYIFKIIKGFKTYELLTKYLTVHEDEAFQLGVFKNEDNVLEIPPKRTFNHYLQTKISGDQKKQLEKLAGDIMRIANQKGILLDINIAKKAIREKKKNYDREVKETIKFVKNLVYPQINLKIHHNAKFTTKDLLDVLVHVGLTHDFTNNGSYTFKQANPSAISPSGDLMMHHFSKFKSIEEIQNIFDRVLDIIFKFAKKEYNLLNKRKLDIAYDVHKVCYYGKQMSHVMGGEFKDGTSNFFEFLTCSIVVAGKRFILDVIPIHPFDRMENLIEKSLIKIKKKIHINLVYLDRGFDRARIIDTLNKNKVKFLMPKVRTPTVKAWFDKSEGCKSRIVKDFQIGRGKEKVFTNLILVDDESGLKRPFISNWNIAPSIAYRLYGLYSKRWGIEISYRNIEHDFKPRTTSRNYHIRLFYFLFSACLFNLWVLANICIGLLIYGRVPKKPIITAKMFTTILYRIQEDYFDPGG